MNTWLIVNCAVVDPLRLLVFLDSFSGSISRNFKNTGYKNQNQETFPTGSLASIHLEKGSLASTPVDKYEKDSPTK